MTTGLIPTQPRELRASLLFGLPSLQQVHTTAWLGKCRAVSWIMSHGLNRSSHQQLETRLVIITNESKQNKKREIWGCWKRWNRQNPKQVSADRRIRASVHIRGDCSVVTYLSQAEISRGGVVVCRKWGKLSLKQTRLTLKTAKLNLKSWPAGTCLKY